MIKTTKNKVKLTIKTPAHFLLLDLNVNKTCFYLASEWSSQ